MLDEIDQLVKSHPQSPWVEDGLFATAKLLFGVNLDRESGRRIFYPPHNSIYFLTAQEFHRPAAWRCGPGPAYLEPKAGSGGHVGGVCAPIPDIELRSGIAFVTGSDACTSAPENTAHCPAVFLPGPGANPDFPPDLFLAKKSAARLPPRSRKESLASRRESPRDTFGWIPPRGPHLPLVDQPWNGQGARTSECVPAP